MSDKDALYNAGLAQASWFCETNGIAMPNVSRLQPGSGLYRLIGSCAFYRPRLGINIAVEKCAHRGRGGRAWSWPAYAIDRTPYGVIQHELGHHVDHERSAPAKSRDDVQSLFSWKIYQESKEQPLTNYLGTDDRAPTFFMEWFAEIFRLYVTNPDFCFRLRPKFHRAAEASGLRPLPSADWESVLRSYEADERIMEQARKKIGAVHAPLTLDFA